MSENNCNTLNDAKEKIDNLMQSLNKSSRENLMSYIVSKWMCLKFGDDEDDNKHDSDEDDILDDPLDFLYNIVKDLRAKVPVSGILPSENLIIPKIGKNSINESTTLYLDAFLYDDDEWNQLEKKDKISTHYCEDCGSKNTKPLSTYTHSLSRDHLYYIFNTLLPTLQGKTVLDVGSRLGAVLYGAYVFTDAAKIIGVEMNEEFCDLQNDIIKTHKMENRVEVINKRIEEVPEIVASADVVLLHNVFEFFLPENEQIKVWEFLRENVKKGAYIIARPSLEISLENINSHAKINIDEWVKRIDNEIPDQSKNLFDVKCNDIDDDDDEDDIRTACYKVL